MIVMQQTTIFDTKLEKHNKTIKTQQSGKNRTNWQKLVTLPVMETEKARAKAKQYIWSKMGDWLMDVAKYFVTTILVSSIFTEIRERTPWIAYSSALVMAMAILLFGVYINRVQKRKEFENE